LYKFAPLRIIGGGKTTARRAPKKGRRPMSRQEEAKIQQRFIKKPIWSTCSNCVNYRFDNVKNEYGYTEEKTYDVL